MVTERKGLDLVVEALRKMEEADYPAEFHVIGNRGEGEVDYDRLVLSDLRQLLGDRLVLHGILPALEAVKIVAHCEVLVAPSREEMFGNQLIEGLLVGAMPVVTEGTAMAENVARFGCGRIVPQEDADSIAAALSAELRANSAEKNPDMEMARDRINEYMGPKLIAQQHFKLYQHAHNDYKV